MELATINKEIAAGCFYCKPVGDGKTVSGESVRFAEIIASIWEHLRIRTYIKDVDNKSVTAICEIHDTQSNVAISLEVATSIITKYGKQSDSQIEVTKLATQAKARRNGILQIVPKGYFEPLLEKIRDCASGKFEKVSKDALITSFSKYLKAFKKHGIEEKQVFEKLEISTIEEITPDILADVIGFGTAIKEGTQASEIFGNHVNIDIPVIKENLPE
jgi:hypothetical protein